MKRTDLQTFLLLTGVLFLTGLTITTGQGSTTPVFRMGMVALIMATWWIFEVLPLGITAFLPVIAYPLLGIMPTKEIAPIYMSSILLLFVGGFFVAIAMERWCLHKRLALNIIGFFGASPGRLMAGFMCSSGFLSMWISNTAATVMMVSIGLAIVKSYEEIEGQGEPSRYFASSLMMSIAYAATIGGIATLVGTPPNLAFSRIYALSFPQAAEIGFGDWILFGIPTSLIMVTFAWWAIWFFNLRGKNVVELDPKVIAKEKAKLGPLKYEEKIIFFVFASMALLWISRKDLNLGFIQIPGWSNLMANPSYFDDGTVAILMAMILFMVPTKNKSFYPSKNILDQSAIRDIPWQTILLFGGGFALAKGMGASGLSAHLGEKFKGLAEIHPVLIIASLTGGMSFLTELTSNMASTEMILPILASISKATGIKAVSIMIPATLAASCAFMLPAATAPNAIIFGSQRVDIKTMVRIGFLINLFSITVITLVSLFLIPNIV
jgi:solute carrier family 13 (sodium-dependent dicarboxylate transporter), member 2/3/5